MKQLISNSIKNMAGKIFLPLIFGALLIYSSNIMFLPNDEINYLEVIMPIILLWGLVTINCMFLDMLKRSDLFLSTIDRGDLPKVIIKVFRIIYDHFLKSLKYLM